MCELAIFHKNDKDTLSIAITEYAFHGRGKSSAYILETKELYAKKNRIKKYRFYLQYEVFLL